MNGSKDFHIDKRTTVPEIVWQNIKCRSKCPEDYILKGARVRNEATHKKELRTVVVYVPRKDITWVVGAHGTIHSPKEYERISLDPSLPPVRVKMHPDDRESPREEAVYVFLEKESGRRVFCFSKSEGIFELGFFMAHSDVMLETDLPDEGEQFPAEITIYPEDGDPILDALAVLRKL